MADEKPETSAPETQAKPSEAKSEKVTEAQAPEPQDKSSESPNADAGNSGTKPAQVKPTETKPAEGDEKKSEEEFDVISSSTKKRKRPGVAPPRGKKLRKEMKTVRDKLEKAGAKPLQEAVEVLKKHKRAKFDETVEIHMSLGVDVSQADQIVRGTVSLPHGIGKSVRVLVFCQGENEGKAKEAGADFVGNDDLIKKVQGGWTDFDVALATHDMMGKVGRLGKILGPRGLMPTPKAGTVVTGDVAQAVLDFKAGKVEYRTDKTGNVHAGVGKMSFETDKLAENIQTFINQIRNVKPASVKGTYIQTIFLTATQSPSVQVTA